jgi:hypothetical protein
VPPRGRRGARRLPTGGAGLGVGAAERAKAPRRHAEPASARNEHGCAARPATERSDPAFFDRPSVADFARCRSLCGRTRSSNGCWPASEASKARVLTISICCAIWSVGGHRFCAAPCGVFCVDSAAGVFWLPRFCGSLAGGFCVDSPARRFCLRLFFLRVFSRVCVDSRKPPSWAPRSTRWRSLRVGLDCCNGRPDRLH